MKGFLDNFYNIDTRRQRRVFRAADPAARVAITTLTMTREKDISLHMKDGHV
jgi:hypothetical protein